MNGNERARAIVEAMLPNSPEKWDGVEERGHARWMRISVLTDPPTEEWLAHDPDTCDVCQRITTKAGLR